MCFLVEFVGTCLGSLSVIVWTFWDVILGSFCFKLKQTQDHGNKVDMESKPKEKGHQSSSKRVGSGLQKKSPVNPVAGKHKTLQNVEKLLLSLGNPILLIQTSAPPNLHHLLEALAVLVENQVGQNHAKPRLSLLYMFA